MQALRFRRALPLVILFAVAVLAAPAPAKSLRFTHIDVHMTLNQDTSIDVVEEQKVRLDGKWNGLYRNYRLTGCDNIEIISLHEGKLRYTSRSVSHRGNYTVRRFGNAVQVRWRSREANAPPYRDAAADFTINYRMTGAVAQYSKRDVFYWKPIFSDREYDVERATVTLKLPRAVENLEVTFYTKAPNAKWEVDAEDRSVIRFSASSIPRNDHFEVKIAVPKGVFAEYASARNRYFYHFKPWIFPGGVIGALLLLAVLWRFIGRDPVPSTIGVDPIDIGAISPGIAGLLIDERFDDRDLTATILDLARRGYLTIEQKDLKAKHFEFELIKAPAAGEVAEYEMRLLEGLFEVLKEGETTSTKRLKNKFYSHIPEIKKAAWREVKALGWFDILPSHATLLFGVVGAAFLIAGIILAGTAQKEMFFFMVWGSLFGGVPGLALVSSIRRGGWKGLLKGLFFIPFVLIGAGVLIGVTYSKYGVSGWRFDVGITVVVAGMLFLASGPAMAKKSRAGAAVNLRLRELRNSLRSGAWREQGEFASLLPWAVAFGVVDDAIKGLTDVEGLHTPYYRPYHHRPHGSGSSPGLPSLTSITNGLSSMSSAIGSSLSSSPSSSGGSGGGSGGGGGGGGGGGRGGGGRRY